jgi:hypothetical protein
MSSRVGITLASIGLAVAGVMVVVDAPSSPAVPTVSRAATGCLDTGAYRAPDPGSVGVPEGLTLCRSGSITISEPGAVLDGWDVTGGIVVDAPDVVVRRTRVTGDGSIPYGIRTTGAGSVHIEDTTLTGDFPEAAVGDDRWTGTRVEITRVTHDGARAGVATRLRNSTLHDFLPAAGTQPDALVLLGTGDDVLVEDNRIERGPGTGSAVRVGHGVGGGRDGARVVRGNVLGGGSYTVREDPGSGGPSGVWITDNRFGRDAATAPLRVSERTVLAGNRFVDGGSLPDR